MTLLSAMWGASYLFMRIAGPVLGSVPLMGVRVLLAGTALLLFSAAAGKPPDFRSHWRQFLVLGAIGNAIPFVLIANAVLDLNVSLAAILNATTPMFAALIAAVWMHDSFGPRKILGALLGVTGVAVLVGWSPLPVTATTLLAAGQALLASFFYGLTVVYARLRFQTISPLHTAVGQLCGSSVLLLPFTLALWPSRPPTWPAVIAVLGLAFACSALAYLIYFHLIRAAGPVKTSTVTFLVPFFSILWGKAFFMEPMTPGIFAGLGVILLSVWLVLGAER